MIMNIGTGGGSAKYQLIVKTDTGSTVTATKGSVTKTAKEKNGACYFKGLTAGDWVLTLQNGSTAKTTTVTITDVTKCVVVTLYKFMAVISVKYPSGSICKCEKENVIFTASDTLGTYAFYIYEPGEWVISCTNGIDTRESVVSITIDGQIESVEIIYATWLYKNGDQCIDVTGGWGYGLKNTSYPASGTCTFGSDRMTLSAPKYSSIDAFAKQPIDLTRYTTIYVNIIDSETNGTLANFYPSLRVCEKLSGSNSVASVDFKSGLIIPIKTYSLDVTELTGEYYLFLRISADSAASWAEYSVGEVYLK